MNVAELSRIDRSIIVKAAPERVWHALTSADELSTWFQVRIEGDIAPGAEIWMTSTHATHQGQRFPVRIVAMEKPRRLVWEWHPGEIDPAIDYATAPRTTVTFTLEPADGGTRVSVAETGFDTIELERRAKAYQDNTQGWAEVMVWLQRHVESAR